MLEFYHNQTNGTPQLVNDSHMISFGMLSMGDIEAIKRTTLSINDIFQSYFRSFRLFMASMTLVYGRNLQGELTLGGYLTPENVHLIPLYDGQEKYLKDYQGMPAYYKLITEYMDLAQEPAMV